MMTKFMNAIFVIVTLIEWPDDDYGGNDAVPIEPIKQEWVEMNTPFFQGKALISVWDVSKVKEWKDIVY